MHAWLVAAISPLPLACTKQVRPALVRDWLMGGASSGQQETCQKGAGIEAAGARHEPAGCPAPTHPAPHPHPTPPPTQGCIIAAQEWALGVDFDHQHGAAAHHFDQRQAEGAACRPGGFACVHDGYFDDMHMCGRMGGCAKGGGADDSSRPRRPINRDPPSTALPCLQPPRCSLPMGAHNV